MNEWSTVHGKWVGTDMYTELLKSSGIFTIKSQVSPELVQYQVRTTSEG